MVDRATNRRVASWPLFERPARVALYGDIAILSGAERHGVYALRISDGRLALIGVARPGDRPLIGQAGVVYLDDLDRSLHKSAPGLRRLVLVPLSAVRRELDRPYTTVREYMAYSHTRRSPAGQVWGARVRLPYVAARNVGGRVGADPPRPFDIGRITSISMDGPRVALAVHDPSGRCDRVFIWNVPWHYVVRLSGAQGLTCLPQHAPGGVTGVVMAGGRAAWATTYGTVTRIIAASTTACREWVVARSRAGAALAGDGAVLAYALGGSRQGEADGGTVGIVPKLWRGAAISASADSPTGISVDGGRIAALQKGGLVQIRTRSGRLAGEVRVGPARALALRERTLAVLTSRGALDVYRTPSMSHVHHWRLPANVTAIDLHYGIALLTANRDVFAMHVKTGRIVRLVRAPRPVRAQLEGPGAVIQFNLSGRGMVRFLPMSWIEAQLQ